MVSIIIPAYNAEKFIEKALECATSQDYDKLEIIVVDDGSTDGTLPTAQAVAAKDRRIKVISQPNGGPGAARNTGLENATGEWIVFADCDDLYPENYISHLHSAAQDNDSAICSLSLMKNESVYAQVHAPDGQYSTREFAIQSLKGDISPLIAFSGPVNRIWSHKVIKENNIRFDTNLRYGEDTLFNLQVLAHCTAIGATSATSYTAVEYGRSLSRSFSQNRFDAYNPIRAAMDNLMKNTGIAGTDIEVNKSQYFTDNFLARCGEILALNTDKNNKLGLLQALLDCGIVNSKDITVARGKKLPWKLLSMAVSCKSSKLLLVWFIMAPKMGV